MKSLPEALVPWRDWLNWFDPELAAHLGGVVQRLHPLLGQFSGHGQGGPPEWQGLDDLRTRGPYERLLASEWLLAEELPDEFLRRAVSGEHIFLAPRPCMRRAAHSIIALFDAGPLQLGAPRLAHLAMWILLARRAQQARGEMRWGVLQQPGELFEAQTIENLKTLLFKRTFALADSAHVASWCDVLAEQFNTGERWLIGSPATMLDSPAATFTHRVSLRKELRGEALGVSLLERSSERRVRLLLPTADSVAPLLRGSFQGEASTAQSTIDRRTVSLQRPPIIAFDGTRVGVSLRDEPAALVFLVPKSSDAQQGSPRENRWSAGCSALAASFMGKKLGVLLSDETQLRFWPVSMSIRPCPGQEQFHAPGSTAAWLACAWLQAREAQRICVIDQSRRLLSWQAAFKDKRLVAEPTLHRVREDVLGFVQLGRSLLAYVYHESGRAWFSQLGATGDPQRVEVFCEAPADATVLFGRGNTCAVRLSKAPEETWRVTLWSDTRQTFVARLPESSRAIGLVREPKGRIGLMTFDQRAFRMHYQDGSNELIYSAPARVVSCSVCPNTALIAMLTQERQLIVFAAASRELKLCVQTARQAHAGA